MRKSLCFLLLIFFCSLAGYAQNPIQGILADTLHSFASDRPSPVVVSVGNFTYADKEIGSRFSRYLEENLSAVLSRSPGFELFARDRLEEILETLELSLSNLFDQSTVPQVGKLKAIQAIFSGRFFEEGAEVRVFLELVEIESGTLVKKASFGLPRSAIPASVSVLPDNYNDALFVIEELAEVQNADNRDFVVKAWTPRGEGGVYRDGEQLVIRFYANRDCFIKVYHVDVNKNMKHIFPNRFYPNNWIRGRRLYKIPDSSYPFTFELTAPYGTEFIKVIASTVQFDDIEESFQQLGSASGELVSRGLSVKARAEQVTEALTSYTIIE
ncbi:MAG: DUF4384 domain-containing protein [Planctomycetes bacterium]|nr:DUF4384 domain-containing protein [Planctomycetota bacterium]